MIEIKLCPFDGKPATVKVDYGNEVRNMEIWVECECGAKSPRVEGPSNYGFNPRWHRRDATRAAQEAIEWWNRRAPANMFADDNALMLNAADAKELAKRKGGTS